MFSQEFLSEIKVLALKIALFQRNEDHMQDISTLHRKFKLEQQELAEASEQWDELPDVTYYAGCMVIILNDLGPDTDKSQAEKWYQEAQSWLLQEARRRGVTIAQLEAGTLAKYRLRPVKDIAAERVAILSAVKEVVNVSNNAKI